MTKLLILTFALILSQYSCEKFSIIIEKEDVETIRNLYKDGSIQIKNYKEMNNKKFIENIETELSFKQLKKLLKTSKILRNSIVKNKNNVHMWHLDRINQRNTKLDSSWSNIYNNINGENTNVYILESNIENHEDFKIDEYYRCDTGDCVISNDFIMSNKEDTHGNNVIGLVNGQYTGVATKTTLKVVDHSDFDFIGESIDFSSRDAVNSKKPSIINISFGCEYPTNTEECSDINSFITDILDSNVKPEDKVLFVVAAGNENVDSCLSPLYHTYDKLKNNYISVGSTNIFDEKSYFTNWGNCIDIYAPGTGVITTDKENKYVFASGTSFSSPIVSGIVASMWSSYPSLNAQEIRALLLNNATPNKIKKNPEDNDNIIIGTNKLVYYKNELDFNIEQPDIDITIIQNPEQRENKTEKNNNINLLSIILDFSFLIIGVLVLTIIILIIKVMKLKLFK